MKKRTHDPATVRKFLPGSIILLGLTLSFQTSLAQNYAIDWHKIAGGGGISTGAGYTVSGTIGQPDTGNAMTGGNYALVGGFWSLIAMVQTSGSPLLCIKMTGPNTAMIYWPSSSSGWSLEVSTNLAAPNWQAPGETMGDNGTDKFIIVTPPTGSRFYRLRNP